MPSFDTGVGDRLSLHVENPPGDEKRLAGGALREISAVRKVRRVRHVERPEDGRQRGALGLGHRHLVNESFESKERRHAQKLLASAFAELAGHREIVTCSDPFVGRQTNVPRKGMEVLDERGHQLSHARIARLGVASDDFVGDRLFARSRRRCAFARGDPPLR